MLSVWSHRSIIHFEVLNDNLTFNTNLHTQQLQGVHENFQSKRPTLVNKRIVVLILDNLIQAESHRENN